MNSNPPAATAPPPVRLSRIALIIVVLVIIGLVIGLVPRWHSRQSLNAETKAEAKAVVEVISPVPGKSDLGTPIPAEVTAFIEASIHARASGYLKSWLVDIGDSVTNGQLLAEIDTPELSQQIAQAKAQVDQAKASLGLAKTTADRWAELVKTASVSDQDNAEKQADYILAQANVEAAQANLRRLEDLKNFDRVTAPFAGIITARNTDIGHLISAGSGPELFHLAQTDPLRIYVRVPQSLASAIKPGQKAALVFQDAQGKSYEATVTRTAGAVDSTSRTLQVELQVPNPHNEILAGSYAQVRFNESVAPNVLTISDNALIFRAQGLQIALLGRGNKVHLQSVQLGRDFGNTVQILAGLKADDRVINNPPDSIAEGQVVEVWQASATNSPAK